MSCDAYKTSCDAYKMRRELIIIYYTQSSIVSSTSQSGFGKCQNTTQLAFVLVKSTDYKTFLSTLHCEQRAALWHIFSLICKRYYWQFHYPHPPPPLPPRPRTNYLWKAIFKAFTSIHKTA